MQIQSQSETTRHKGIEIALTQKPKENSPLSQPPRVWYWETEGGRGFDKDKEKAIAAAKKHINQVKSGVLA